MQIGIQKFGINFTSIRLDGQKLSIHGQTDDAQLADEVYEIQAVVYVAGPEGDGDALFTRLIEPEREWSATFDAASPYEVGNELYVVGIALRREGDPHAWRNRLPVRFAGERAPADGGALD